MTISQPSAQPVDHQVFNVLSQYQDTQLDTRQELVVADQNHAFWTQSGTALHSLVELRNALETMAQTEYSYHVTATKHDFAAWVESVLQDPDCAKALSRCKKPLSAKRVVIKFLRNYRIPSQS